MKYILYVQVLMLIYCTKGFFGIDSELSNKKTFYEKIIILSLLTFVVNAKDYGSVTVSKVISVYDGDTFRVSIKIYPPIVGENIAIRVNGIDTPEIRGKCPSEKVLAIKTGRL